MHLHAAANARNLIDLGRHGEQGGHRVAPARATRLGEGGLGGGVAGGGALRGSLDAGLIGDRARQRAGGLGAGGLRRLEGIAGGAALIVEPGAMEAGRLAAEDTGALPACLGKLGLTRF